MSKIHNLSFGYCFWNLVRGPEHEFQDSAIWPGLMLDQKRPQSEMNSIQEQHWNIKQHSNLEQHWNLENAGIQTLLLKGIFLFKALCGRNYFQNKIPRNEVHKPLMTG